MKTLFLSLKHKPFEVMVTGEKREEFRKPSKWMLSRMFKYNKDGSKSFKKYDLVKFVNGYGNDKPYLIAEFAAMAQSTYSTKITKKYSNGLEVEVEHGDIVIVIGKIIEKGNLKKT